MALEVAIAPLIKSLSGEVRRSRGRGVLPKSRGQSSSEFRDSVGFDRSVATLAQTYTHILFLAASERRSNHRDSSKQRNGSLITVTLNLRKATSLIRVSACYRDNTKGKKRKDELRLWHRSQSTGGYAMRLTVTITAAGLDSTASVRIDLRLSSQPAWQFKRVLAKWDSWYRRNYKITGTFISLGDLLDKYYVDDISGERRSVSPVAIFRLVWRSSRELQISAKRLGINEETADRFASAHFAKNEFLLVDARTFRRGPGIEWSFRAGMRNRRLTGGGYRITERKCISANLGDIAHCRRHLGLDLRGYPDHFFPPQDFLPYTGSWFTNCCVRA